MHFVEKKKRDYDDFSTSQTESIYKSTGHHYISKSLKIFLQNLKSNLLINEVIILLDFSENFSFIIQGGSQGFRCEDSQCTVHPFVVYHQKSNDDEITHKNFCFLSLNTRHNTSMVHTFISALVPKIKCFITRTEQHLLVMVALENIKTNLILYIYAITKWILM